MTYYIDNMELEVIATSFSGSVNDVLVCRDLNSTVGAQYTLIVIHDRDCIKTLLSIIDTAESEPFYDFYFAQNDSLIYGFRFRQDRKFTSFARGQMLTPIIGETISINLVMECISTQFPPQLLYLILTQDNVHVTKENGIYFTPVLDLSLLDKDKTETDCTVRCAEMIMGLLQSGTKKKLKSCELIRKKCKSNSYSSFSELYRDIRLTAIPEQKLGIKAELRGMWLRNKDKLFRLLLALCVVIAGVALIMLISQLIFGDIPLLRLFKHCFDVIGTEHLN